MNDSAEPLVELQAPHGPRRWTRKWVVFRIVAVLIGLSPLWGLELGLRLAGWRPKSAVSDPYVGFSGVRPLFELASDGLNFRIAENRKPLFCDDGFLANKPGNGKRIFCVGGSTVQGRPFARETAFSTWLQISLQTADPSRYWEVVNCGGVSYASYRLRPIMEEILKYQPDLIILYTGHNEFLEDRTYASVRRTPTAIVSLHERMMAVRSYAWIRSWVVGTERQDAAARGRGREPGQPDVAGDAVGPPAGLLPTEVEARLDFRRGLDAYHRDDTWREQVVNHFKHNLRAMIEMTKAAGVPLVLMHPVCNLRDAAPFKSEHREGLSISDRDRFDRLVAQAGGLEGGVASSADPLNDLEAAVAIDPRYAALQYRLGQAYQQQGNWKLAREHLIRAREEDVCPLRMIEAISQVIRQVAAEASLELIDADAYFQQRSPDGIVGRESLVDHVHPSIAGHQQLADLIFRRLERDRLFGEFDDDGDRFGQERAARYESHLASLPNLYFELGKDRLAGLKRWASGQVTRERESPAAGTSSR